MKPAIAIERVGIVSPLGLGFERFSAALREGAHLPPRLPLASMPEEVWPPALAHWLHDFDARVHLGDKGVSALDRMTQMALIACGDALRDGMPLDEAARQETGVVLGCRAGSMRSIADFVQSTYTGLPHMVSPMQFTNTVMNCAAGQCAIWHRLRGVNSTVCAGDLSGFAALHYASRMLRQGHATRLLAGAVEEYGPFAAWSHAAGSSPGGPRFAEAAVVFGLSLTGAGAGRTPQAELLGTRLRSAGSAARLGEVLQAEVEALLASVGCRFSDLAWWSPGRWAGDGAMQLQQQVMETMAPGCLSRLVSTAPDATRHGHAHGAATALDLAGALALAPAGVGLLTAVGDDAQLACVLVRKNSNLFNGDRVPG